MCIFSLFNDFQLFLGQEIAENSKNWLFFEVLSTILKAPPIGPLVQKIFFCRVGGWGLQVTPWCPLVSSYMHGWVGKDGHQGSPGSAYKGIWVGG